MWDWLEGEAKRAWQGCQARGVCGYPCWIEDSQ